MDGIVMMVAGILDQGRLSGPLEDPLGEIVYGRRQRSECEEGGEPLRGVAAPSKGPGLGWGKGAEVTWEIRGQRQCICTDVRKCVAGWGVLYKCGRRSKVVNRL